MGVAVRNYNAPVLPTPELAQYARELLHYLDPNRERFALIDRGSGETIDLPPAVYGILRDVLTALARNQATSVLPTDLELTTNQAADLLNVSRGFVVGLVDSGELPHRMVGTHRRIRLEDALEYREKMQKRTTRALDELAKTDQELGFDD